MDKRFKAKKKEKTCKMCKTLKPISDFSPYKKNGRTYCRKCEVVRAGEWAAKNPERRAAQRKAYNDSPAGKLSSKLSLKKYTNRYPERRRAIHVVEMARKNRTLERRPCELCGAFPTEAHHSDYSKPLSVTWLCRKHHIGLHTEQNRKQPCL